MAVSYAVTLPKRASSASFVRRDSAPQPWPQSVGFSNFFCHGNHVLGDYGSAWGVEKSYILGPWTDEIVCFVDRTADSDPHPDTTSPKTGSTPPVSSSTPQRRSSPVTTTTSGAPPPSPIFQATSAQGIGLWGGPSSREPRSIGSGTLGMT